MQKNILFNRIIFILGFSLSIFYSSNARAETDSRVLSSSEGQLALAYSNQVSYYYSLTAKKTEILYEAINNFLAEPSENIAWENNGLSTLDYLSGFSSVTMTGSSHNDEFHMKNSVVRTKTNFSGGVQGGISNGENIVLRAAFKPTGTIVKEQQTVDVYGNEVSFSARGRHDPCVLPRAVPIVESMTALVLIDHILRQRGQVGSVMKNHNSGI